MIDNVELTNDTDLFWAELRTHTAMLQRIVDEAVKRGDSILATANPELGLVHERACTGA